MTPYDNIPDSQLDEVLDELEGKIHRKDAIARMLPRLKKELAELDREELRCRGVRILEQKDVDKLKRRTPLVLWLMLRGELDSRMDREEREAMEAEARWAAVCAERDAVADRIKAMEREDRQLGLCREHYAELLERKQQLILSQPGTDGAAVAAQQQAASAARARADEYAELITYGQRVLAQCGNIQKALDRAAGFTKADMWLDGGFLINEIKYDDLDTAQSMLDSLTQLLSEFRTGLADAAAAWPSDDLEHMTSRELVPSTGMKIADYLFDNPVTDALILHNINRSRCHIADLSAAVSCALSDLRILAAEAEDAARLEKDRLEITVRKGSGA